MAGPDQGDREGRLEGGLIEAGEGPSGIGRLELGRGDFDLLTFGVGVLALVKAGEALFELSFKL